MPMKFKESAKKKGGGMQNYYMHATPLAELHEALERESTPNKLKQKIRNYLSKKSK